MKRIIAAVLTITLLAGLLTLPVLARDTSDVAKDSLRNQILFDDMYFLCETVDQGDPGDIIRAVLIIYPDVVALLKHNLDGSSDRLSLEELGSTAADVVYREAVYFLFRSDVFFNNLCRLTDIIKSGDNYALGTAMYEVYPDWVATLKRGIESQRLTDPLVGNIKDDTPAEKENTVIDVPTLIVGGVVGAAIGAVAAWLVMRRKKTA